MIMILLVTPVWNDSQRLARYGAKLATTLAAHPQLPVRWIIADDGSGEQEHQRLAKLLKQFQEDFPEISLHLADAHRGKGSVVREAWSLAPEADWFTFVDADGSLAPSELVRMLETAMQSQRTILGVRKRTETTRLEESPLRALAHRTFILAVRWINGLRCEDPQCGAKVIKGDDYRRIAPSLKENGLAFDAEMIAALSQTGALWEELPVTWIEQRGGKVNPTRDAWGMLAALWKIRARQRNGDFSI